MTEDRYYSVFSGQQTRVDLDQKKEIVSRVSDYGVALDVREASVKDYDEKFTEVFDVPWLHGWVEHLLDTWPFLREGKYEELLNFILLDLFQATTAKATDDGHFSMMYGACGEEAEERLKKFIQENGPMGLILAWGFHINYRTLTALNKNIKDMNNLIEFVYACDKRTSDVFDKGWQAWTKIIEWLLKGAQEKGAIDEKLNVTQYGHQVLKEYQEVFGDLKELKPAYNVAREPIIFQGTFPFFRQLGHGSYPPYYKDWDEVDEPWDEEEDWY